MARPITAVPALADVLTDPSMFDGLPYAVQDVLFEQAVVLEARLRVKIMARHRTDERSPMEPDRAVEIKEAGALLGMSRDYLYRHWKKLGGYRDDDGHIKFAMSAIQRHIHQKASR